MGAKFSHANPGHHGPMAEGDTILRAARRLDAALTGETVAASAPNPRGRAAGIERLDGRRLEARRVPRQEPAAALRRPRPAQPHGDERLLARLPPRRALAQAAPLGLGGAGGGEAGSGPVRRPDPAADPGRPPPPRPPARPPRPRHPRAGARPRRRRPAASAPSPARSLGDALLDQTLVAGIGNIFKSEACFAARVDPWRPLADLGDDELRAVLAAARAQMLRGGRASGRHTYAVYRGRRPCPVCRGRISSRGQGDANRTTYWCPRCQV